MPQGRRKEHRSWLKTSPVGERDFRVRTHLAFDKVRCDELGLFFRATTRMYDSIAFTSEAKAGLTTYLEWSGTIFGGEVGGATVVSHDEAGLITSVRLYHRPLGMVTRFASELARRLSG
jgi:hypothetical protein